MNAGKIGAQKKNIEIEDTSNDNNECLIFFLNRPSTARAQKVIIPSVAAVDCLD